MYVIRNTKTDNYIRLSSSNERFPRETRSISDSYIWNDLNHAKHYFSLFPENKDWVIEEIVMSTKPIVE